MIPLEFKEHNAVYTKPEGWTDDQCGSLPSFKGLQLETPVIISCWKITDRELDYLMESGGNVWLTVMGNGMPPVALTIDHELDRQQDHQDNSMSRLFNLIRKDVPKDALIDGNVIDQAIQLIRDAYVCESEGPDQHDGQLPGEE